MKHDLITHAYRFCKSIRDLSFVTQHVQCVARPACIVQTQLRGSNKGTHITSERNNSIGELLYMLSEKINTTLNARTRHQTQRIDAFVMT